MLKITVSQEKQATSFTLAGRLVGPWVEELRRCWQSWEQVEGGRGDTCRIDLRETTHVDAEGKALLSEMFRRGATFKTKGCLTRAIVESLATAPGLSSHERPMPKPAGKSRKERTMGRVVRKSGD